MIIIPKNIIILLAATAAIIVCICSIDANAAPRNGQNRMPVQSRGNSNSNNNNNNNYASQRHASNEQQIDPEESNQSEINDESGAVDPEFASLTDDGSPESAASNAEADETEDPSSSSSSSSSLDAGTSAGGIDQTADSPSSSWLGDSSARTGSGRDSDSSSANEELYGEEPRGEDSNIANAKIKLSSTDMSAAAGHHYHGHGVSGWLEMGAHTGKKGAFGWHDKHPVGGKGRR